MKDIVQAIVDELDTEKLPKPKVAYERVPDGFYLYTIDPRATKILAKYGVKFRYQLRPQQYFVAFVEKLVRRPGIFYYEYKVVAPSEHAHALVEKLNQKRLRMYAVIEKMNEKYAEAENALISELQKHGLKLKPGAPLDAQLLDRKYADAEGTKFRLHFRQSLKKVYNQEVVEELSKKYPILKSTLRVRETPYLDRRALEEVLPQLPPNVAALIVSLIPISSFNEEPLTNPECEVCGGNLNKSQVCRHCGLSVQEK